MHGFPMIIEYIAKVCPIGHRHPDIQIEDRNKNDKCASEPLHTLHPHWA